MVLSCVQHTLLSINLVRRRVCRSPPPFHRTFPSSQPSHQRCSSASREYQSQSPSMPAIGSYLRILPRPSSEGHSISVELRTKGLLLPSGGRGARRVGRSWRRHESGGAHQRRVLRDRRRGSQARGLDRPLDASKAASERRRGGGGLQLC